MALQGIVIYLNCILVCALMSLVTCLTLPNMVTVKPRHTKYSSPTPSPLAKGALVTPATSAPTTQSGVAEYRVKDHKGITCILLRTDALIEVNFKSNIGDEKGDAYIPKSPLIEGDCKYEDQSSMRITWNGYSLVWNFAKTPGGERWYISGLELTISTELPQYHNIKMHGNNIRLIHNTMAFPTPVGKSYSCDESILKFTPNEEDDAPAGLSGTLFLRALQVQPFMYKGANFGQAFECNAQLGFRDETAPIAVGSTLAVAVLLTVSGYAVFRYFKIKKVQYNTME